MTKKYWKYIFSHIKNVKRFAHARRLLMEVILMHWVTFISHITGNEYHGAQVFRSIPNCIYVLEVIGLPTPDEGAEITSRPSHSLDSMAIHWKIKSRGASSLAPRSPVCGFDEQLRVMNCTQTRKLLPSLFMRPCSAALDSHLTRDLHGKVFCVMRNKSMHEITSENFFNLFAAAACARLSNDSSFRLAKQRAQATPELNNYTESSFRMRGA